MFFFFTQKLISTYFNLKHLENNLEALLNPSIALKNTKKSQNPKLKIFSSLDLFI